MKKGGCMAMTLMLAVLFVFVAGDAVALNPQPEVPSKDKKVQTKALNTQPEVPSKGQGKTQPKALNPQPEVPSKGEKLQPKALNPQPEVPSKTKKKKKKKTGDKEKSSTPAEK